MKLDFKTTIDQLETSTANSGSDYQDLISTQHVETIVTEVVNENMWMEIVIWLPALLAIRMLYPHLAQDFSDIATKFNSEIAEILFNQTERFYANVEDSYALAALKLVTGEIDTSEWLVSAKIQNTIQNWNVNESLENMMKDMFGFKVARPSVDILDGEDVFKHRIKEELERIATRNVAIPDIWIFIAAPLVVPEIVEQLNSNDAISTYLYEQFMAAIRRENWTVALQIVFCIQLIERRGYIDMSGELRFATNEDNKANELNPTLIW